VPLEGLDPQTLYELAELICGDGGPKYRRGWELPEFFGRSGVKVPDRIDESRRAYALAQLESIADDPRALERVILRLADPREYGGAAAVHEEVVRTLNALLAPELLQITLQGHRPRLDDVDAIRTRVIPSEMPSMNVLCTEPRLARLLEVRWQETERCLASAAYLSALVIMGSLLEGALYAWVTQHADDAKASTALPRDRVSGRAIEFSQWSLSDLINVSYERLWIQQDIRDFSHVLRDYRNLVHPAKQRQTGFQPDRDTCSICWEVVRAALNDLVAAAGETRPDPGDPGTTS